jgi:betaine-homocysteine S-methyltransferase
MKDGILERLRKGPVLGAQGYVFELERRGYIKAGPYVPEVVLDNPDALRELHSEFLNAGAEVMEALTYYAHRDKLRIIGREKDTRRMNIDALHIASDVARRSGALVAGNICNTWIYDPNKPRTFKVVHDMYEEQVGIAASSGVDFIIAETLEYVGEALIALEVIKKYDLPAMITFGATYEESKDGYDWIDGCRKLEEEGADIVGFNCIRGPSTMMPLIRRLRKRVNGYIAAQPVPYHTTNKLKAFQFLKYGGRSAFPTNLDPFLATRDEMAAFAAEADRIGVNYIGICCGAGPHHVRAMAEVLGRMPQASKYSPNLSEHSLLGTGAKLRNSHEKRFLKKWK